MTVAALLAVGCGGSAKSPGDMAACELRSCTPTGGCLPGEVCADDHGAHVCYSPTTNCPSDVLQDCPPDFTQCAAPDSKTLWKNYHVPGTNSCLVEVVVCDRRCFVTGEDGGDATATCE